MDLLKVALMSIGSIITLFILTKIMGNRQMSQLSMFDYINGITIGSIAAEMATALETDYRQPLLAMVIYAIFSVLVTVVTSKSIVARRILTGKAVVLYENGKLYEKNISKCKLDISEFLSECRIAGYFDLSKIQFAVQEPNGKISFIPVAANRPATPSDFNLTPKQEGLLANVIIDGNILKENLKNIGKNEQWLNKALKEQGVKNVDDVFLATCDKEDKLSVYVRIKQEMKKDKFE